MTGRAGDIDRETPAAALPAAGAMGGAAALIVVFAVAANPGNRDFDNRIAPILVRRHQVRAAMHAVMDVNESLGAARIPVVGSAARWTGDKIAIFVIGFAARVIGNGANTRGNPPTRQA